MRILLNVEKVKINFLHNNIDSEGISLSITESKITALIGNNGSGKTTLFNAISGFLKCQSGKFYFTKMAMKIK